MSMLLASLGKKPKPAASKSTRDVIALGLSDSDDDDDVGVMTQKNQLPNKKAKTQEVYLLSDDESEKEGGDGETFEDEKKRIADRKVEDMLAEIKKDNNREQKSPTPADMPKNVSKGRGRGKGKRGKAAASSGPSPNGEDTEINNYLASLRAKKSQEAKNKRIKELKARQNEDKDANVEFLDLPDIPTAMERESSKPNRDSLERLKLLTDDLNVSTDAAGADMDEFTGDFDGDMDKEQDADEGADGESEEEPKFSINTRLNGEHEHVFQVPQNGSWSSIRKVVSDFYSLKATAGLKLKFDGQELKGQGTPEDEDMEAGDLVDLEIKANTYNAAVTAAQAKEKAELRANGGEDVEKVKFKTRLNGEHGHKWRVAVTDTFKKIKEKFADFYGLKMTQIKKFEIDGANVLNGSTPEEAEMIDGEIIDVTIPSTVFANAVAHAEAKKGKGAQKESTSSSSSSSSSTAALMDSGVKAKKSREDRIQITFDIQVLEWVSADGKEVHSQIKQFADTTLESLKTSLIRKKIVREDADVIFTLPRPGRGTKILKFDTSLTGNGVHEGCLVQVRPPNIQVIIKPKSISADGKNFVGSFSVDLSPISKLGDMISGVLKKGHLIHPQNQLNFSLILNKGAPKLLGTVPGCQDMDTPIIKLGFYKNCEVLVEKK